jgi:inhibitor of KinA
VFGAAGVLQVAWVNHYNKLFGGGVVKILSAGDTALTIEFGEHANREVSAQVLALDRRLTALSTLPGVLETVPTMRSLTVYYDPRLTSHTILVAAITPLLTITSAIETAGRRWTLPVCYDRAYAPDMAEVAATVGLPESEIVRLHTSTTYRVYMLGFLPGQAYLGDLPAALHLPRRLTPRTAVPPGSVAIASSMTTVYPLESPGGWHLIGRCPVRMFDPDAASPVLLAPADDVRFRAITTADLDTLMVAMAAGTWQLTPDPFPAPATPLTTGPMLGPMVGVTPGVTR